jgi:hypothetical protein
MVADGERVQLAIGVSCGLSAQEVVDFVEPCGGLKFPGVRIPHSKAIVAHSPAHDA